MGGGVSWGGVPPPWVLNVSKFQGAPDGDRDGSEKRGLTRVTTVDAAAIAWNL